MFLKALTIKGFKSFADTARLELEPGITVVVGPNGSGKSNVVDAMAWVLGAQAPTAVRSQKMDDVIFAGTSGRKPLGRAEVSLTIDNADGLLSLEFNEVTITRTLFRSGDSDYAINGVSCRLLDIQELLSDSGVGRQQHIIVSQGRIDDVLNARPEERRGIIEEAAGVLKYRKRKERAERRMAGTEENLKRLKDLLREVRRQIRPLEKQAAAARRHEALATELKGLKVWLAGRQLKALSARMEQAQVVRQDCNRKESAITSDLSVLDAAVLEGESRLTGLGASDIGDIIGRARSMRERIRGQHNVVGERRRRIESELEVDIDGGLAASLEAEAARLDAELISVDQQEKSLAPRFAVLAESEEALKSEQLTFDTDWGDGLAPKPTLAPEMRTELRALEQAAKRNSDEAERIHQDRSAMAARIQRVSEELEQVETTSARLEAELPGLGDQLDHALGARDEADRAVTGLLEARRAADAEAGGWKARCEALGDALDDARSRAGADALDGTAGVVGTLLDTVAIEQGWESAVEAAVGEALNAVVVDNPANAANALRTLEAKDLAGAVLALGRSMPALEASTPPTGVGLTPLRGLVEARRADVEPLLDLLLSSAVAVDGEWSQAIDVSLAHPYAVVVTNKGDRFGPGGWRIGLSGTGATGAALEEAEANALKAAGQAAKAAEVLSAAQSTLARTNQSVRSTEDSVRKTTGELEKTKAAKVRANEQLSQFQRDTERLTTQAAEVEQRKTKDQARISQLRSELPGVENEETEYHRRVEALSRSRTTLEERTRAVGESRRSLEVEAASLTQRRQLLLGRQQETDQQLERMVEERERARIRRQRLQAVMVEIDGLFMRLTDAADRVDQWLRSLEAEQQVQSDAAREVSETLTAQRHKRAETEKELNLVRERRSQVELEETECRVKLEALTEAVRRELDTEPRAAMQVTQPETEDDVAPEARVRTLEAELSALGVINPLALEEFAALKERYEFIESQLDDVKTTRRELNAVIRSIDAEIVEVFSAAYADVSINFLALFSTLFPGGKGGVTLTNAEDILNCGVEIEAKPSGKNVKKLSLLSGGERSLVALAFLFAVFRSRPSPFYVMDEVEAALDDVNLSRFLGLLEEFRRDAQLIVVSHQKRTMEAADVLYGVSMKPGGSSKVVSEKVDERRTGLDLTQVG